MSDHACNDCKVCLHNGGGHTLNIPPCPKCGGQRTPKWQQFAGPVDPELKSRPLHGAMTAICTVCGFSERVPALDDDPAPNLNTTPEGS